MDLVKVEDCTSKNLRVRLIGRMKLKWKDEFQEIELLSTCFTRNCQLNVFD